MCWDISYMLDNSTRGSFLQYLVWYIHFTYQNVHHYLKRSLNAHEYKYTQNDVHCNFSKYSRFVFNLRIIISDFIYLESNPRNHIYVLMLEFLQTLCCVRDVYICYGLSKECKYLVWRLLYSTIGKKPAFAFVFIWNLLFIIDVSFKTYKCQTRLYSYCLQNDKKCSIVKYNDNYN